MTADELSRPARAFMAAANRPVIVCDIDGVLAFTAESIAAALDAHFGANIVVSQMTNYRIEDTLPKAQASWIAAQLQRGVFYANVAPDYSAIAALGALHSAGFHLIVSSDRPTEVRQVTDDWLAKWRVPHDEAVLLGRGGKRKVLAPYGPERPAILIDDDPAKALTVARPGVQVWSPARPWTPVQWRRYANYWVFDSWAQALDRLGVDPLQPHGEPANSEATAS